jgi:hypothetical protein
MDIWNPIKEAFAVKGSLLGIVSLLLVGAGAGYFVSHERMTAKDEKLSMKDEELKQCRGRVDFLYAPTLKVNGITSADLRAKTLQVATGLRYVLSEYRRRIDSALQQRPVSADEMQRPFSYVIEQYHSRQRPPQASRAEFVGCARSCTAEVQRDGCGVILDRL